MWGLLLIAKLDSIGFKIGKEAASDIRTTLPCGAHVRNNRVMERTGPDRSRTDHQPTESDWEKRLAEVDWSQYWTAYGEAGPVKLQLRRLQSEDKEEALSAAHDLWCGLCHQHVQIGSAALPALPFLLEAFAAANDRLKIELLDIFLGLAITSNPQRMEQFATALGQASCARPDWIDQVRSGLEAALPSILPLRTNADPDIAEFARGVVDELASTNPSVGLQHDVVRPLIPDFHTAATEFTKFAVKQGYPPNLLWVTKADVLLNKWQRSWTNFVWKGDPTDRQQRARSKYQNAVANGIGLALEAKCKTDRWTICRIYVPVDRDDAERRMIPQTGVKHLAVDDPRPAVLVERRLQWRILKWFGRRAPFSWD